jgi:hypothetical protein
MYLSWTNIICKVSNSRKQHSRDDSMKTNIRKHPFISLGPKTRASLIMEPSKEIRILIAWDVTSRLLMNKCRMCIDRYKTYHWCKILSAAACSLFSLLSFNWVQDWHSSNSLQSAFWRASPGFCLFPQERLWCHPPCSVSVSLSMWFHNISIHGFVICAKKVSHSSKCQFQIHSVTLNLFVSELVITWFGRGGGWCAENFRVIDGRIEML